MENGNGSYELVSLENLNGGQIVALFDRELATVLDNIADENTAARAKREITLKIAIRPEDDRGSAVIEVSAKSSLAPVKPSKSFAVFAFDGNSVTAYQSDPKQLKLGEDGKPENERPFRPAAGEVR
ncbi:MAG: hypothetical protein PHS14_18625 [Elusimicrobia bacterium]|nr:hypothetical protein [Elusimicrobiota bacterium]